MSRVNTRQVTMLEARHPTDGNWWGQLRLDPCGKNQVHVRVVGQESALIGNQSASLPFVSLDELQELIDVAREQCAARGFVE